MPKWRIESIRLGDGGYAPIFLRRCLKQNAIQIFMKEIRMGETKSVLVVCLNPTFQKTMVFKQVHENEVNRTSEYFLTPSGKGVNVARILTQLHRPSVALTHLGGNRKQEFIDLCSDEQIELGYFNVDIPIRTCTTVIDRKNSTSTELVEEPCSVPLDAGDVAWNKFIEILPDHDAVVITGTRAKGYGDDLYPRMVSEAKKENKLVILDLKGADLMNSFPYHPDIAKPNLSELISTFDPGRVVLENEDTQDLYEAVSKIASDIFLTYGIKLVISRGKFSTWAFDGTRLIELPNRDVPVVNTIGCGDALTAGMTHKLLEGCSLAESVQFGMECAIKNSQSIKHGLYP
ncbi:MAG: carbohydrate kinase [Bacilli bacterium]|nr:carbohydrate kinase [Bacilli bacterium]